MIRNLGCNVQALGNQCAKYDHPLSKDEGVALRANLTDEPTDRLDRLQYN